MKKLITAFCLQNGFQPEYSGNDRIMYIWGKINTGITGIIRKEFPNAQFALRFQKED